MTPRVLARIGAVVAAASCAVVSLTGGIAWAHVTIDKSEQVAGAYTVLTVAVPHGCGDSPTTEIRIQIPMEIPQVTPTRNPNWDVAKVMEQLDEPIGGGHGVQLTERVAEVVYTAKTPLPDGVRDTFELSLKTPDTPGATLYFPVVQICEEGETAWVERPTDAVESSELEEPAPSITLVAADHDGSDNTSASNGLAVVALIVGVVGVVLGGTSLLLRRRRS